ncbi:MAG: tetraacyldisaccharide 4'-kinase [Desulfomonile tiedjei]|nr:tetraacyldisaccharide 4'-kinase [Desulfomonile tiedjei]
MSAASLPLKTLLSIPAAGYHAVQKVRETAYRWGLLAAKKAPVRIVSVGNLVLGGSGKTPFVIYLADLLQTQGWKPAVVSRGYKGANRLPYLVVGDGSNHEPVVAPSVCGDEPFLIAHRLPHVPVIIGRRRIDPVLAAVELFDCDIIVLDDGFQHLPLHRDVDVVLLTGAEDRMFPLGYLREPLSALRRAQMIVLVGSEAAVPAPALPYVRGLPVFTSQVAPTALLMGDGSGSAVSPDLLAGQEVILASAIARPERFRTTAEKLGWKVIDHLIFKDHHSFSDNELRDILSRAATAAVVFTEKDWVKLPAWFKANPRVGTLRIDMTVEQEEEFRAVLQRFMTAKPVSP